jgi:hypothetical protein
MAKFPEPPAALREPAEQKLLPAGTRLWRVHYLGGPQPARWNAFRGILYLAASPITCIAEVFQVTRVVDRNRDKPWLTGFETTRDVTLIDLTGAWPTRAGASIAINTGPRPRAQGWSRLIYATYPDIEGLLYCSSMHANQTAVALDERALNALPAAPIFSRALGDAALPLRLDDACRLLGYGLV